MGGGGLESHCVGRVYGAIKFDIQRTVHREYAYNKTNEMHQFLKFIFGIKLYMFRTGFLSIIRSLVLYTQ